MSADPEKAMEVVDDNDHESLDEDDEAATDGDKMEVLCYAWLILFDICN